MSPNHPFEGFRKRIIIGEARKRRDERTIAKPLISPL